MCKASLQAEESGGTWDVNEFVEQSIKRLFPLLALERQNGSKEEQLDDANIPSEDLIVDPIPIFEEIEIYFKRTIWVHLAFVYFESNQCSVFVSVFQSNEFSVFVCTTSFPKIPCPLHVCEPRHRLMIRSSIAM